MVGGKKYIPSYSPQVSRFLIGSGHIKCLNFILGMLTLLIYSLLNLIFSYSYQNLKTLHFHSFTCNPI